MKDFQQLLAENPPPEGLKASQFRPESIGMQDFSSWATVPVNSPRYSEAVARLEAVGMRYLDTTISSTRRRWWHFGLATHEVVDRFVPGRELGPVASTAVGLVDDARLA